MSVLPRDERKPSEFRWTCGWPETWSGRDMRTRCDRSHISPVLGEAEHGATKRKPRQWNSLCFLST